MAVRFLLDENVPATVVELLRKKRFQVRRVQDVLGPGSTNGDVAGEASRSGHVILTFDSDFLKLNPALRDKVSVIYVDVHPRIPAEVSRLLDKYVEGCVQLLTQARRIKLTRNGPEEVRV